MNVIRVEFLADHPALVDTVIGWHWHEWSAGHADANLSEWRARLVSRSTRDRVPFTLIGLADDGAALGCVSVTEDDQDDRLRNDKPWLSGMFVIGPARNQGVGRELLRVAESHTRALGASEMWLWTDTADGFYRRCGWETILAKERVGDHAVMRRAL